MRLNLFSSFLVSLFVPFHNLHLQNVQADEAVVSAAVDLFDSQRARDQFHGFLQANGDGLEQMVSFDWGLHFFRNKGLLQSDEYVEINGISMKSTLNGKVPWREWGGLNDQFRSISRQRPEQEQEAGRTALAGQRLLSVSPFNNRLQQKAVFSHASRFYRWRGSWTITQEMADKRHRISGSIASRLGGFQGPFSSFSYLLSWAFRPKTHTEWAAVLFGVQSVRAKASPVSAEVIELLGPDYNPNGGVFRGKFRSSRTEWFHHPALFVLYRTENSRHKFQMSAALQKGSQTESRLAYRSAPHPSPIYYRYLPSYINFRALGHSTTGLSVEADLRKQAQVDWQALQEINASNRQELAHYSLLGDHQGKTRFAMAGHFWVFGQQREVGYLNVQIQKESRTYHQKVLDLLGARWWRDEDPFTKKGYDIDGPLDKTTQNKAGHHYFLDNQEVSVQGYGSMEGSQWRLQTGGHFHYLRGFRKGLFLNQLYLLSSLGDSSESHQRAWGSFLWGRWNFNLRQQLQLKMVYGSRPHYLDRQFVEPKYSNVKVNDVRTLPYRGVYLEFKRRQLKWDARVSCFLLDFQEQQRPRTYYLESGLGEGLVTEHLRRPRVAIKGFEGRFKTRLNPTSSLEVGFQFRDDSWGQNADLIWHQRAGATRGVLPPQTTRFIGQANIKGLSRGNGPQSALGIRWDYRSPDRWWLQTGLHFLWNNSVALAPSKYSSSFSLSPDRPDFEAFTNEELEFLRRRENLPKAGYIHISGGKSWRNGNRYTSLFLSLQNLTDLRVPTGGFEQGRVGHAELAAEEKGSGTPLFGNKYWVGQGRSFFLNLSMSY